MRAIGWVTLTGLMASLIGVAAPAVAQERDDDGSQMQARHVEVGSVYTGRLAPPDDEADWRVFELEEEASIEFELTVATQGRTADLTLAGATGRELATGTAGESGATISQTLGAGIYYIAVEGSESLEYELSIW